MDTTEEQLKNLQTRLTALERRAAGYRNAFGVLVVALAGVAVMGATTDDVQDVVRARELLILTARGDTVMHARARADSMPDGGGWLTVRDVSGGNRVTIWATGNTQMVGIYQKKGVAATMSASKHAGGGILNIYRNGLPVDKGDVSAYSRQAHLAARIETFEQGAMLSLMNTSTRNKSVLLTSTGSGGFLGLGHGEASMEVVPSYFGDPLKPAKVLNLANATDTSGLLIIQNKTGETVVTAHADEYGNGVVGAYNRKGVGRTLQPEP